MGESKTPKYAFFEFRMQKLEKFEVLLVNDPKMRWELDVKVAGVLVINMCFYYVRYFGSDGFAWGVEFIAIYLQRMTLVFFCLVGDDMQSLHIFPFN